MDSSLCGTWDMIDVNNLSGYMNALDISYLLQLAVMRLQQQKIIEKRGDEYTIKTLSSLRNYIISFQLGQEFLEVTTGLDDRHVKSLVTWQDNKLVCKQTGEKKDRGWTHWVEDDKLHLQLYCEGQVCTQVFKRINGN